MTMLGGVADAPEALTKPLWSSSRPAPPRAVLRRKSRRVIGVFIASQFNFYGVLKNKNGGEGFPQPQNQRFFLPVAGLKQKLCPNAHKFDTKFAANPFSTAADQKGEFQSQRTDSWTCYGLAR